MWGNAFDGLLTSAGMHSTPLPHAHALNKFINLKSPPRTLQVHLNCLPKVHILQSHSSADGAIFRVCRAFGRRGLAGGPGLQGQTAGGDAQPPALATRSLLCSLCLFVGLCDAHPSSPQVLFLPTSLGKAEETFIIVCDNCQIKELVIVGGHVAPRATCCA